MKILKILTLSMLFAGILGCMSCNMNNGQESDSYILEYAKARDAYGTELKISRKNIAEGDDLCYTKEDGLITINAATALDPDKDIEIILEGYFKGQIVNNVKGLIISLKSAFIENENDSAILCNAKTEISAKKDTDNYVVNSGESSEKIGAITSAKGKNLEFGGSGTCFIIGNICHGVKTDKAEFKGSGKYYVQGTENGSAVNCNNFVIKPADPEEPEKMVSLYMYNAKNGIKADNSINIQNGKLYFYGNKTALKTENAIDGETPASIDISNCEITLTAVEVLQKTDKYTKGENVVINIE